jgi:hypothetical protein
MICFQNSFLSQNTNFISRKLDGRHILNFGHTIYSKKTTLKISSNFSYGEANKMKNKRLKVNLPLDNVILELQSNDTDNEFLKFCFLNRDTISYVLLYQITALKLKGEENEFNNTQAYKIKELRKKILENIQLIDQPITQSLIVSEKVVKEILSQDDLSSNINSIIKKERINISSLWIVLTAAISAWQRKIKFGGDENSKSTLEKLQRIKDKIFSNENFRSLLSMELLFLDSNNFSEIETKNIDIEVGLIDGLKLLTCILEKLPKSSYGALLDEISNFHDVILEKKLGLKKSSLLENSIQFYPKKINTDSRLVNIKDQSI